MPFTPAPHPGILHHYARRLVAFEHAPVPKKATSFILFVGGMGDDLLTVRYPTVLAAHAALPESWAVAQVTLTSSGTGWLTSSLQQDTDELAQAVAYFRALSAKNDPNASCQIILLGHSTGSQDVATYLIGPWAKPAIPESVLNRPKVDGVVLQAGISDREGLVPVVGTVYDKNGKEEIDSATGQPKIDLKLGQERLDAAIKVAKGLIAMGQSDEPMSSSITYRPGPQPTAYRWWSTTAPDGDDDLFSTTNPDERNERVFGAGGIGGLGVPLQVLIGEKDEHMLEGTDRAALVSKWESYVKCAGGVWDEDSGVVPGATHNLNNAAEDAVQELCGRILRFVGRISKRTAQEKL